MNTPKVYVSRSNYDWASLNGLAIESIAYRLEIAKTEISAALANVSAPILREKMRAVSAISKSELVTKLALQVINS